MDVETRSGRIDLGLRKRPRGEVVAFGKLMAALETMKSKHVMVEFQIEVYEDATVDVPLPVLTQAVARFVRTPGAWRPAPGDLLEACEAARLDLRQRHEFMPCEACSEQGWVEREINGVPRMVRCKCWEVHQQKIAALGASAQPLALPAPVEDE